MRKTIRTVGSAFIMGETKKVKNDRTENYIYFYHDSGIAWFEDNGKTLALTLAGWPTVTTRDRLNSILTLMREELRFYQKGHTQFFGNSVKAEEIEADDIIRINIAPRGM